MKFLIFLSLMLSQVTFASIRGSSLEPRHHDLIVKKIITQCGHMMHLEEVSHVIQVINVDQDITDKDFFTQIRGVLRIDQGIFDVYKIYVTSHLGDHYDHQSGNWGAYSVSDIKCIQE